MLYSSFARTMGAFALLAGCALLSAQTTGFSGSVTDSSGGAISGAHVSATDQKTSQEKTALADAAGQYAFSGISAGTYTIKVEFPGFTPYEKKDFAIADGTPATLQITLTPSTSVSFTTPPPKLIGLCISSTGEEAITPST